MPEFCSSIPALDSRRGAGMTLGRVSGSAAQEGICAVPMAYSLTAVLAAAPGVIVTQ